MRASSRSRSSTSPPGTCCARWPTCRSRARRSRGNCVRTTPSTCGSCATRRSRTGRCNSSARSWRRSASLSNLGAMDDQQALDRIDNLVKEEEQLLHRHEGEGLDDDEHARLEEIKVQLDKTWDYLRQRRSLREAGDDPDQASERDGGPVEDYGKVTPYDDTDADAPE